MRDLPPELARAAAVGALVLAVSSRGDLAGLAVLLVVAQGIRPSALAVAAAAVATSWRWGTTSLDALAGAQAVLGPAGGVGPTSAAVGTWAASIALLLALARGREPVALVAVGATVAAVLAGPAPGGELPVRVIVGIGASVAAVALARVRVARPGAGRALDGLALASGAAALVATGFADRPWPPSLELGLVGEGAAVALGAIALVLVGGRSLAHPRWRRGEGSPTVDPLDDAASASTSRPR